jgi:hypothetical protein
LADDELLMLGARLVLPATGELGGTVSVLVPDPGASDPALALAVPAGDVEIAPGAETVCVVPFSGDLGDPSFRAKLDTHVAELDVHCKELDLNATPAVQAFVIATSLMKRIR